MYLHTLKIIFSPYPDLHISITLPVSLKDIFIYVN